MISTKVLALVRLRAVSLQALVFRISVSACRLTWRFAGHHRLWLVIDVAKDLAASTFQRGLFKCARGAWTKLQTNQPLTA